MADLKRNIVITVDDRDFVQHREDVKAYRKEVERAFRAWRPRGGDGQTRQVSRQGRALKEVRQIMAQARVEFDRFNLANRRGALSNKEFADAVERMRQRTVRALDVVQKEFRQTPREVQTALSKAGNSLQRFSVRAQEVATGQTRLRTRIGQGIRDVFSLGRAGVAAGVLAATFAMRRAIGAIKDTGTEFERVMAQVRAISGSTTEEFKAQTDAVRELGATTIFTATQAAEGMTLLARAGFDVSEQIKALPGTLDLAAAGQLDLATATEIAATTVRGFGLAAEETGRVADVLANTATSSNSTVRSLGETFKQVAPIAASLNISIEEVAAAAGLLGDAALQGEKGGIILRNLLIRLIKPTKEVQDGLKAAGFVAVDAAGNLKSLTEIIRGLEEGTKDLTTAERGRVLAQIASLRAVAGLTALTERGADALADFTESNEQAAGAAKELAEGILDNLAGDMRLLTSAAQELALTLFDRIGSSLRGAVQGFTSFITSINNLNQSAGELANTYQGAREEIARLSELEKAVKTYDDLSRKTKRSKEESDELRGAVAQLTKAFPGLITNTDAAGNALGFYTDRIRDNIDAQRTLQLILQAETLDELIDQYQRFADKADEARIRQEGLNEEAENFTFGEFAPGTREGPLRTLEDINEELSKMGTIALDAQKDSDRALKGIIGLLKDLDKLTFENLVEALESPKRTMEENQILARQLLDDFEALQGVGSTGPIASPSRGSLLGTALGDGDDAGGDGGGDEETDRGLASRIKSAERFLQKAGEAARIAAKFTGDQKKALMEVFKTQEVIKRLKEAEVLLGKEAVKDALEGAQKRLVAAQAALARADAFASKVKEAADAFNDLVREDQILRGAGLDPGRDRAIGVRPGEGDPRLEAARRRAAQRRAQERKETRAAHEETLKFTDAQVDAFNKVRKAAELNRDVLLETDDVLGDMAAAVDAVARLADVFGDLSDEARQAASGIADALDSAARLRDLQLQGATGLATLPATLGIAGGITSALVGVLSSFQASQDRASAERIAAIRAQTDLRKALEDNARRVSEAIDRFVNATQFGTDLTGDAATEAAEAIQNFLALEESARRNIDRLRATGEPGAQVAINEIERLRLQERNRLLALLERLGFDLGGAPTTDELTDLLESLLRQGAFSDSIDGLLDRFSLLRQFVEMDLMEAFGVLRDGLLGTEGLPDALREGIGDLPGLADIDVSTPEGRQQLQALLAAIATLIQSGEFDFGGLTPAEVRQVLDSLQGFTEDQPLSGDDASSATFQIQRNITEVQADAVIRGLEIIAFWARDAAESLRRIVGGEVLSPGAPGGLPGDLLVGGGTVGTVPISPETFAAQVPVSRLPSVSQVINVQIDGITVGQLSPGSDRAREIGEAVEREVRRRGIQRFA